MPLIDMKRPKKKENVDSPEISGGYEKYPWGIRLTLENEELKKLGMNIKNFPVGKTCKIEGEAEVTSVSENENIDDKESRESVGLQIKKIAINPPQQTKTQIWQKKKNKGFGVIEEY